MNTLLEEVVAAQLALATQEDLIRIYQYDLMKFFSQFDQDQLRDELHFSQQMLAKLPEPQGVGRGARGTFFKG